MLAAVVVLHVDVTDGRQKVLHDLDRVRAALLQLADVGAELHVARVDGLHHRVGFVARFDAGAGVLVEDADDADIVERLAHVVQGLDDVRLVLGKDVVGPLHVVRPDDGHVTRRTS